MSIERREIKHDSASEFPATSRWRPSRAKARRIAVHGFVSEWWRCNSIGLAACGVIDDYDDDYADDYADDGDEGGVGRLLARLKGFLQARDGRPARANVPITGVH